MGGGSSSAHYFCYICASARKDRTGRSLRFSISIVFALTQGALHTTTDFPMEEDRLRNMRLLELRAALRNNMDVNSGHIIVMRLWCIIVMPLKKFQESGTHKNFWMRLSLRDCWSPDAQRISLHCTSKPRPHYATVVGFAD